MRLWIAIGLCGCDRLLGLSPVRPLDAAIDSRYPPYVSAVLADSPVGYFRLDETTGVAAVDLVGGPNGTYVGNVMLAQPGAFSDANTSVGFDGANSAVTLADRFDFTGTKPFSLEAWIRPSFQGTFHELGSRWQVPPGRAGYTWYQDGDGIGFERDASDAQTDLAAVSGVLVENQWTYVVATYDGATMAIYVSGRQITTIASATAIPEVGLATMIGAASGEADQSPFLGGIDEYAIYDHALTPERVDAHFAAATP